MTWITAVKEEGAASHAMHEASLLRQLAVPVQDVIVVDEDTFYDPPTDAQWKPPEGCNTIALFWRHAAAAEPPSDAPAVRALPTEVDLAAMYAAEIEGRIVDEQFPMMLPEESPDSDAEPPASKPPAFEPPASDHATDLPATVPPASLPPATDPPATESEAGATVPPATSVPPALSDLWSEDESEAVEPNAPNSQASDLWSEDESEA